MQRYSRKRQAILDCLRGTKSHPTAEWIYTQLKPSFPDLSLATVYRNLSRFKDAGLVRSMGTVNGQERFDADTRPHTHAVCLRCGKVLDVCEVEIPGELIDRVQSATGFSLSYSNLMLEGICKDCQKNK